MEREEKLLHGGGSGGGLVGHEMCPNPEIMVFVGTHSDLFNMTH